MMNLEEHEHGAAERAMKSTGSALFWIVLMNIVFSFGTVLSAVAPTDIFIVMAPRSNLINGREADFSGVLTAPRKIINRLLSMHLEYHLCQTEIDQW